MTINKLSRRSFFEKSLCLSAIPLVLFSLPSSAAQEELIETPTPSPFPSDHGMPDLERIAGLLKQTNPLMWVFTGDSITAGVKHTHGARSYPEVFSERIRWEMGRGRDQIINTGISGNTTRNIIADFNWRIKKLNPSVVSLMIGTNDCAIGKNINLKLFKDNLEFLINGIRALGAIPILHTPNLIITDKAHERSSLHTYVEVIKGVAKEQDVILVDHWEYWKQEIAKTSQAKVFKEWLNDPLHPNGGGHAEIARLMFRELGIFNTNDPTCGGTYYEGEH